MAERGFTDPVRVDSIHDSVQTVKEDKWNKHDLTLMLVGATLGCMVTVLFVTGVLLLIGGKL